MSSCSLPLQVPAGIIPRIILISVLLWVLLNLEAQVLTIGAGTVLHQGLPIEPVARFSYTQQLFHASQIGISGDITQISFQYHVQSNLFYNGNKEWSIYLGHSSLSQMQDWVPITQLSPVFEGILPQDNFGGGLPGSGWLTIPLHQPFYYDGSSNLIVAVDENTDGAGSTSDDFFCTQMSTIRALNFQSPSINPDPADPPATINPKTHLSNIRLHFGSGNTPTAPQNLYGYYSDGAVRLFWDPPQSGIPDAYLIHRNSISIAETAANAYSDAEAASGNTYLYSVRARFPGNELSPHSNHIQVEVPAGGPEIFLFESFEALPAFSQSIPGYSILDLDMSATWAWNNVDFPGEESPMGWMVFAPAQTQPPLSNVPAHSGSQMLVSMSAVNPPNNDWLILPNLRPGTNSRLSFWARSFTSAFGLERLRVMISTSDALPQSFTPLSGEAWIGVPATWTLYEFDLNSYAAQDLHLALNCVSMDAFALFVDDLQVSGEGGHLDREDLVAALPKPFPNPGRKSFKLSSEDNFDVSLYNLRGQHLASRRAVKEFSSEGIHLAPGMYLLRIMQQNQVHTFKQVILP
jgi:hypothetical protein